jgi:hypothetical protein
MARARAIETRLEKLVPALDEYYSSGFLTREETLEVSRQRTHWEYRLVAKPLLLLDVRGAITYELGLERRLREYCNYTKLNLQHRWDIVERIEGIYKIGLKHLKNNAEHESLRQEYVLFLKQFQRNGSLSNLYGELMVTYPRRSDIWVEAAEWQCTSQHNTDNARAILQQALLTMSSEVTVWACALRVELQFVQRLLDGLLAEHREEARKARKKASEVVAQKEEEEDEADGGRNAAPARGPAVEPTSVIAPKLRAENASMGQVLLDLALAKAVVEEAFDSPASGAPLMEQLLSTAGAFAFSQEVMQVIVSTATHKLIEACFAADTPAGRDVGALSIASQQQQLRVRVQWRHRRSIDTVFAAYLSLEDALVNRYATAIVDTATYLSDGGSDAVANARQRQPAAKCTGENEEGDYARLGMSSFANPPTEERHRAAVKALVTIIAFALLPASTVAALPAVTVRDAADSTQHFVVVRQALTDILRRLAGDGAAEGVSKVCAALLLGSFATSESNDNINSNNQKAATARKHDKRKGAATLLDVAEVAKWILRVSKLDKATQQACIEEPKVRTKRLAEEIASAESAAPPPTSRMRKEASSSSATTTTGSAPLLSWSVMQLGRFLRAEDRDVLCTSDSSMRSLPSSSSLSPTASVKTLPLTAEDVERFIVWWKEEEAQLQHAPIVSASEVAASQARRRMAVVDLLKRHGLTPTTVCSNSGNICAESKKRKTSQEHTRAADTDTWAATKAILLNRTTALQYRLGATKTDRGEPFVPLSMWRIFSALETMLGPFNPNAPNLASDNNTKKTGRSSSSSNSNCGSDDSDEDDDSTAVAAAAGAAQLSSFAAAGLHFLSGASSSTLDRQQEWVRLEGVTSLLRCRLVSWLGRRVCTRDAVAEVLRDSTREAAEDWIADLQGLLVVAQRCQPLPRYAQTHCVLPFLEGVAVYRSLSVDDVAKVHGAVQAAREAHEALLRLYGVSKHPESYLPLVYDGTPAKVLLAGDAATATTGKASTTAVQQANTEDWAAYVLFERTVSKDLLKAKTVVERGRRSALSPQQFMVKLNAM